MAFPQHDKMMRNVQVCNGLYCTICKNFNIAIFSDTIDMINVKLFTMVVLIGLYLFTPLSVTLIVFEG